MFRIYLGNHVISCSTGMIHLGFRYLKALKELVIHQIIVLMSFLFVLTRNAIKRCDVM